MKFHYFIVERGPQTELYKFPASHGARLRNEFAISAERVDFFEDFETAKEATLIIVERYTQNIQKSVGMFSKRPDQQTAHRLQRLSGLTEDQVEQYFP